MKKTFVLKIFLIVFSFILCTTEVFAIDLDAPYPHNTVVSDVSKKSAILLCEYRAENNAIGVEIYYHFANVAPNASGKGIWNLYYLNGKELNNLLSSWDGTNETLGYYKDVFMNKDRISYNKYKSSFDESFEDKFVCPRKAFIDRDGYHHICLGEYETCGGNFEDYVLTDSYESVYSIINSYAEETVFNNITLEEYASQDLIGIIKSKTIAYLNNYYSFQTTYYMPEFIKNYVNNIENYVDIENSAKYSEFTRKMSTQADQALTNGQMSEETVNKVKENAAKSYQEAIGSSGFVNVQTSDDPNCSGLLGPQMTEVINNIFSFIQYLGPVLVIVLTIVDFFKASVSGEKEDMNKATKKFVQRAIAAVLLFFVPLLCKLIFSIGGITVPDFCIK